MNESTCHPLTSTRVRMCAWVGVHTSTSVRVLVTFVECKLRPLPPRTPSVASEQRHRRAKQVGHKHCVGCGGGVLALARNSAREPRVQLVACEPLFVCDAWVPSVSFFPENNSALVCATLHARCPVPAAPAALPRSMPRTVPSVSLRSCGCAESGRVHVLPPSMALVRSHQEKQCVFAFGQLYFAVHFRTLSRLLFT
jgi:hypothetical protein